MKKYLKYSLLSAALLLAACETAEETPQDTPTDEAAVEQPAEDTTTTDETTDESTAEETNQDAEETERSFKLLYTAPHGDQSFASTFAILDGDTVVDVVIDEYQFMEGDDWDGVPNDDEAFSEGYTEELTLISKRENSEDYSAMMADIADSTVPYNENMDAIQDFARGKTISEIENAIADLEGLGEDEAIADVVSGATFVDTRGYLQSIVDTANDGIEFPVSADADLADAELSYSLEAPHGDRAFALVAVLHANDSILGAAMDELQFVDPETFEGVPNSDAAFGENYTEGVVLASKMFNDVAYSEMMAEAGATLPYSENMLTILEFTLGNTTNEINQAADELEGEETAAAEVVSGATFADTGGYLEAVAETAEN